MSESNIVNLNKVYSQGFESEDDWGQSLSFLGSEKDFYENMMFHHFQALAKCYFISKGDLKSIEPFLKLGLILPDLFRETILKTLCSFIDDVEWVPISDIEKEMKKEALTWASENHPDLYADALASQEEFDSYVNSKYYKEVMDLGLKKILDQNKRKLDSEEN